MAPVDCPRCGAKNDPEAEFCQKCGQALSQKAFEEVEAGKNLVSGSFEDLLEDPKFKKIFQEKLEEAVAESFTNNNSN